MLNRRAFASFLALIVATPALALKRGGTGNFLTDNNGVILTDDAGNPLQAT